MTPVFPAIAAELQSIVGAHGLLDERSDLDGYLTEWRGLYRGVTPLVLLPSDTAQVAAILRLCTQHRIGVVPQGGNTGLVGGGIPHSTPDHPEILLSARRLNRIRALDADNFSITAEAGCVLATVQAAAAGAGRFFPLSLAAEGSCQLGGNISTNAGGTAVLRFGTMRDLVLGLEVVLPDGRVLDGLRSLRKDNTGYDLKQLFIGAEGTLGFVTAATCKLFPEPGTIITAWLAVATVSAAVAVYAAARGQLGDDLTAFEFANGLTVEFVLRNVSGSRPPLGVDSPWHLLVEVSTSRNDPGLGSQVQDFLVRMQAAGLVTGGVVAASGPQRDALWRLRHSMSEAQKKEGASIKHDVSVPVTSMEQFLVQATSAVGKLVPGVRVVAFGHLGDGNVHFNLSQPREADSSEFLARWGEISHCVHEIAIHLGGSFSAEHGVGALKVGELACWRGGVPLELMRTIKRAIDPLGIMNPGKLFPVDS
ncbi:MAG: FAD-binding oxidoreductase [Gammaproteobacteria bacterium]|nr:FAD-binding oxidoreductase [Gammaproteobacteria bacterium]